MNTDHGIGLVGVVLRVLFLLLLRLNCLSSDLSSCCLVVPALLLTLIVDVACPDVAIVVSGSHFWAEGLRKMQKAKKQNSNSPVQSKQRRSREAEAQKTEELRNRKTEAKQQPKYQQKGLINAKRTKTLLSSNRLDPLTETF